MQNLVLGCIGGDQQPQGFLQILMNVLDFGMPPQEAINAPRWRSYDGGKLALESTIGATVVHDLSIRGHILLDEADFFGGSQCIMFDEDGFLTGGSDPRLAGPGRDYLKEYEANGEKGNKLVSGSQALTFSKQTG